MFDDETLAGRPERAKADEGAPDAETAAALSKAAREAVRQPADPRLERSFAKLAGVADEPAVPAAEANGSPVAAGEHAATPAVVPVEPAAPAANAPVSEPVAASSADRIARLERLVWVALALAVVAVVLALFVLVRG